MSRFRFELAEEADDAELCALLRRTPMDGEVRVAFCREPSFFAAAAVEGDDHATLVCRDTLANDRIVGMGTRSIQRRWVNGSLQDVGYLSGLRIDPEYRSLGLLARGYQRLAELHQQRPLAVDLTTIATGNTRAVKLLTSGRAGLPKYVWIDDYVTAAIPLPRRRSIKGPRAQRNGDLEIVPADPTQLDRVLEFWRQWGACKQFFPNYDRSSLGQSGGLLRGFRLQDLLVAYRRGRIVGTLGAWNQSPFRRVIVSGFQGHLKRTRHLANLWSWLRGFHGLPAVGEPLRMLFAAAPVTEQNDAKCLLQLLQRLIQLSDGHGARYLMIGLASQDPLSAALRQVRAVIYRTSIFRVAWDRSDSQSAVLDGRPCYLEVGGL